VKKIKLEVENVKVVIKVIVGQSESRKYKRSKLIVGESESRKCKRSIVIVDQSEIKLFKLK